jgi:hypothetical protein
LLVPRTDQLEIAAVNRIEQSVGLCAWKPKYGIDAVDSQTRDESISTGANSHRTRLVGCHVEHRLPAGS